MVFQVESTGTSGTGYRFLCVKSADSAFVVELNGWTQTIAFSLVPTIDSKNLSAIMLTMQMEIGWTSNDATVESVKSELRFFKCWAFVPKEQSQEVFMKQALNDLHTIVETVNQLRVDLLNEETDDDDDEKDNEGKLKLPICQNDRPANDSIAVVAKKSVKKYKDDDDDDDDMYDPFDEVARLSPNDDDDPTDFEQFVLTSLSIPNRYRPILVIANSENNYFGKLLSYLMKQHDHVFGGMGFAADLEQVRKEIDLNRTGDDGIRSSLVILRPESYRQMNNPTVKDLLFNGRHSSMTALVVVPNIGILPPWAVSLMNFVFLAPSSISSETRTETIKQLWQKFFPYLKSQESFDALLEKNKSKYEVVVADRSHSRPSLKEHVFWDFCL